MYMYVCLVPASVAVCAQKQRRASKVGVPMPPAAPVLDSDPTAKAVTPTQKEVRPIEKGSYWLRKQEELSERIKQLELLTNASK